MLITGRVINQLSHGNLADIKMRLAPEYPYPTSINDGYDALKWAGYFFVLYVTTSDLR